MYFGTPHFIAEVCGCVTYFLSGMNTEKEEERATLHHAYYSIPHVHVLSLFDPGKAL